MQTQRQIKKELKQSRKQLELVLDNLVDPRWTPAQVEQMEWAAFQYSENIDLLESILRE